MKLKKISLLDIEKTENEYVYTYGVFATSFFKKIFFKLCFTSKLPHFVWKEIQKMMINQDIYFEDLVIGVKKDIKIGTIEYLNLTDNDIEQYGKSIHNWETILKSTIKLQSSLEKEYNEIHGPPDLTGTGYLSDYDSEKKW
jgi:hypothetical protein